MNNSPKVSAISVIEMARRLKSLSLIDSYNIESISPVLLGHVSRIDTGEDVSDTYDMSFPESWIIELWKSVDNQFPDSPAGLLSGKIVAKEALGMLSSLTRFSETLGQALVTYLQNIQYINESETWQMEENSSTVTLSLSYPAHKGYPPNAVERGLVAMHAMGGYLCGRPVPGIKVEFRRSQPSYIRLLEEYFQCPVECSAKRNALVFPADSLHWPLQEPAVLLTPSLQESTPYLKGILRKSLQKSLEDKISNSKTPSVTNKVIALIRKNLAHYSNSDNVALTLNMSRATLYRKLKKEGAKFTSIRDNIRQELMELYANKKATDVYEKLGFSDISSFYKAKKRIKKQSD